MRLNFGVRLGPIHTQTWVGLSIAEGLWTRLGASDCVVTSIGYGTHSERASHYSGNAFDVRVQQPGMPIGQGVGSLPKGLADGPLAAAHLAAELGPDFQVYFENDHVHAEWCPLAPDMAQEEYERRWSVLIATKATF